VSFFIWLEGTPVSVWIRESPKLWAFPFILYLHTLGLALIAGLSSAIALWLLVQPAGLARTPFLRFFPWMWTGLAINVVSGVALLLAYPAKALTNPVFYLKLVAIAIAVGIVQWLQQQWIRADRGETIADDARFRRAAWALLGLWLVATTAGRLLAYTYSILMARDAAFY